MNSSQYTLLKFAENLRVPLVLAVSPAGGDLPLPPLPHLPPGHTFPQVTWLLLLPLILQFSVLFIFLLEQNKYAIHAYTHGPVTGSGPSVKPLKYVTHLLVAS